MARKLIYARIIHTQADLGSLAQSLVAMGEEALGPGGWRARQERTQDLWGRLKTEVMERITKELGGERWDKLRVYQDGMPTGGETARRIVEELAQKGSLNYQILQELLARGARLEQTEQASLLREEYQMIRRMVDAPGQAERSRAREAYRQAGQRLLERRDRFIARQIDRTLKEGELGLLLLGAFHRAVGYLPQDIAVVVIS